MYLSVDDQGVNNASLNLEDLADLNWKEFQSELRGAQATTTMAARQIVAQHILQKRMTSKESTDTKTTNKTCEEQNHNSLPSARFAQKITAFYNSFVVAEDSKPTDATEQLTSHSPAKRRNSLKESSPKSILLSGQSTRRKSLPLTGASFAPDTQQEQTEHRGRRLLRDSLHNSFSSWTSPFRTGASRGPTDRRQYPHAPSPLEGSFVFDELEVEFPSQTRRSSTLSTIFVELDDDSDEEEADVEENSDRGDKCDKVCDKEDVVYKSADDGVSLSHLGPKHNVPHSMEDSMLLEDLVLEVDFPSQGRRLSSLTAVTIDQTDDTRIHAGENGNTPTRESREHLGAANSVFADSSTVLDSWDSCSLSTSKAVMMQVPWDKFPTRGEALKKTDSTDKIMEGLSVMAPERESRIESLLEMKQASSVSS